jgi:HEAT repeat protein
MMTAGLFLFLALDGGAATAKPPKDAVQKAFGVLERGTRAGDFDVRAAAVAGLGRAPDKKAALTLIKDALKDPQWRVRRAAIEALRDQKDKGWEAELGKAACDPMVEEAQVLEMVMSQKVDAGVKLLLGALGGKDCVKPERYIQRLAGAPTEWMLATFKAGTASKVEGLRNLFTQALGGLPLPAALPLHKAGFAKYPTELQARLVARIKDENIEGDIGFIESILKSKDTANHFATAELLALRGNGAGRAILVAAVGGSDMALRLRALRALAPIAGTAEFELMKGIIKDRETPYEHLIAAYTVYMKSDSQKLVGYLEKELENTDAPQRAAAVHFLGQVKGRAALPELHALMSVGAELVRRAAINAIGRLGQRESIPVLRDALARETNKTWQVEILNALATIKDAEIIPVVRFYINDSDASVKLAALKALASVPDASALPDLEIAARDRLKEIRELALTTMLDQDPEGRYEQFAKALEWIDVGVFRSFVVKHTDRVRRHVDAALHHTRDDLRAAAFQAVNLLAPTARAELLAGVVERSKRPEQRLAALDALTALQGAKAIDYLVGLSQGGDELLRVRAIAHLGRLGHKGAEANLIGWLDDPSEKIRTAAASAVLRL